jgi:Txe/YoeB family toxin of Txe-Axe toxin-antitoxin module
MNSMKASEARDRLFRLLDETAEGHEPILIIGRHFRRINIQHRLVYQILDAKRTVKVLPMWTHHE